jgi:hypothetical protein
MITMIEKYDTIYYPVTWGDEAKQLVYFSNAAVKNKRIYICDTVLDMVQWEKKYDLGKTLFYNENF